MESSPFLLGRAATWKYEANLGVWLWFTAVEPMSGDLDTINRLTAANYRPVVRAESEEARTYSLMGQLAPLAYVRMPGREFLDLWAPAEDIARVDRVPVALAFKLPEHAHTVLPEVPDPLQVANIVPPPQFGESAIIDDGKEWRPYWLSSLGTDALELWHRMGETIKEIAAPAEWWLDTQFLQVAEDPQGYEALRSTLHGNLLAARGKDRERIREQIRVLNNAHMQYQALQTMRGRWLADLTATRAKWAELRNMARQLADFYWQVHQASLLSFAVDAVSTQEEDLEQDASQNSTVESAIGTSAPDDSDEVALLDQLVDLSAKTSMDVPSFVEDRAAREASLAPKAAWKNEDGTWRYKASNNMAVYFLDREHPLDVEEAQAQLLRIRESTVLTVRIALGLWNLRKHNSSLSRNGATPITYNEILSWRGIKKHTHAAYPGSAQRVSDGYRAEDRDDVRRDIELASRYWLRGQHVVQGHNKEQLINIDGPYIHVSFVSRPTLWGTDEQLGVLLAPGGWFDSYAEAGNTYFAEIDQRVFKLNPQNEKHELKIALYLTELWRIQAHKHRYDEPLVMADLLRQSVIAVDRTNLTTRFIPRIEHALASLHKHGIIGSYECLTQINRTKGRWGNDWLGSRWRIVPPDDLKHSYVQKGITRNALPQLPPWQVRGGKTERRKS